MLYYYKELEQTCLVIHCIVCTSFTYLPTCILHMHYSPLSLPPTHRYAYIIDYQFSLQCVHIQFVYMHTHIHAHVNLLFSFAADSFIFTIVPLSFTCIHMYHMTNYSIFTLSVGRFTGKHIADYFRHTHTHYKTYPLKQGHSLLSMVGQMYKLYN